MKRFHSGFVASEKGRKVDWAKKFVLVIATTNKPWLLDEAALDRFPVRFFCTPPTMAERVTHFAKYLKADEEAEMTEEEAR